jgi:hypothetical protein
MRVTLENMSNLGSMNCQTKVVILDLNCDFRMIKKDYNHKTKLLDIYERKLIWPYFSYKVSDLGVYSKEIHT